MRKKHSGNAPAQAFIETEDELIEILDEKSRPFMIMPRETAMTQRLPYQVVLVVIRNREDQIYIHRRSEKKKTYRGLWSVSASGLVKAGEAIKDAAMRELGEELGVTGLPINLVATAEPAPETDWARANLFVSGPANVIINPDPKEISEGMFVAEDALGALLRDMPEMIAPTLKWAYNAVNLFKL